MNRLPYRYLQAFSGVKRCRHAVTLTLLVMLSLAACSPAPARPTVTPTRLILLTPYHTPPSSPTLSASRPSASPRPTVPATPTVTPTPFLHVLTNDDTLLGLALRYGVSLAAIETANPELKPNYLTVGKSVVIPIQATPAPTQVPSPTSVPVSLAVPRCYPTSDGGLWCLALATNDQPVALEDIAAWIGLAGPDGQEIGRQAAILPLNRLPPGAALPLAAFFPPPVPVDVSPMVQLTDTLAIPADDTRYLTATLQVESVDIPPGGLQAEAQGKVLLPAGTRPASVVWVAVVAYGSKGQAVAWRKWESTETLQPGSSLPFTITVYSLGPPITRLEAVVEARP